MSLACASCPVRDRAACAVLSEDERSALARAGRETVLGPGEMLFAAGDEDAACATLVSGALKISSCDAEGNERILALVHPAGFIGELFEPFAEHDVTALTDSKLCTFSKGAMDKALDAHPTLTRALLRRSQEDLHASRRLLEMAGKNSARERVGALIWAMANAASDSPCHPAQSFDLPLKRGEMANLLGLTIETVSRALTWLEKDGTIQRDGARGIHLADAARLQSLAEGEGG
ncbi:MAG: Crp/Fnr family transcriptional regulator [Alteripontixanthobacter sp.]